jgi:hypothetical protein
MVGKKNDPDQPEDHSRTRPCSEKIVEEGVLFFVAQNCPSTYRLYHALHHMFTTKAPQRERVFSIKPL